MSHRSFLVILHDAVAAILAWCIAYLLRFNFDIPPYWVKGMVDTLWLVLPIQIATFWIYGLYRGMWRFASIPDLKRILLAVGLSSLLVPTALFMSHRLSETPRAVLVLSPLLLVLLMGGSRFLYRSFKDGHILLFRTIEPIPVIVMGAGSAASMLLRDLSGNSAWRVVGLLDDEIKKKGRQICGVTVLGPLSDVGKYARRLDVTQVIIAMPSASAGVRRRALELATDADLSVYTVPGFDDLFSGKVSISQIRKVELDDLLGREPVSLDIGGLHDLLKGKVVMVTGAGGSIGSELCRQIAAFEPSHLVMLELNEFAIYKLEQEFSESHPGISIICAIGDVKDSARVSEIMRRFLPKVVFHAAAYKHVPMLENINAWEAIRNNVLGTYTIAKASIDAKAEKFVLISTDKAVNPTNVMGTSKRLAEMVCQTLQKNSNTRFTMVRFGNVLGSNGSVIPKFREQIARGKPVTVTHPEIIRYFMSITEAAQLVLQAGVMGRGGEIFVLDMGKPIKILDLARDMIRLSGFHEDEIKIEFTGLRPGEKLFEELLADGELTERTPHPKLRIAKALAMDERWLDDLLNWLNQQIIPEYETLRIALQYWVPEYSPTASAHLNN
ncbi:MAG: nucleoside-diphosphate sugar epimerase/dehydratase [Proteobacteria bacterium]|nr:nucleoside-diphosphate sugar epimerase/dehydratase [Pseudomonadota bacterium]